MLFGFDHDKGASVEFWILPDHPAEVPRVHVVFAGKTIGPLPARHRRPSLTQQGLHTNGQCGFILTDAEAPGLSRAADLQIYDERTGLLVYRRRPPGASAEAKLFRLAVSARRDGLDAVFARRFHMSYAGAETLSRDTLKTVTGLSFTGSIYVSGRVCLPATEASLSQHGFRRIMLLRDPALCLADALAAAGAPAKLAPAALGDMLRRLKPHDLAQLYNPLTRQLTCTSFANALEGDATARALESLSGFDAIGDERDPALFLASSAVACGGDPSLFAGPAPANDERSYASALRAQAEVAALIALDVRIFDAAAEALARAA